MLRIRIATANLPRLLRDMLVQTILAEDDMHLVGEVDNLGEMFDLVQGADADVVIIGCDQAEAEQAGAQLASRAPRARILAITDGGLETLLFELCPRRLALGSLAPAELLAVIRKGPCQEHPAGRSESSRELARRSRGRQLPDHSAAGLSG